MVGQESSLARNDVVTFCPRPEVFREAAWAAWCLEALSVLELEHGIRHLFPRMQNSPPSVPKVCILDR